MYGWPGCGQQQQRSTGRWWMCRCIVAIKSQSVSWYGSCSLTVDLYTDSSSLCSDDKVIDGEMRCRWHERRKFRCISYAYSTPRTYSSLTYSLPGRIYCIQGTNGRWSSRKRIDLCLWDANIHNYLDRQLKNCSTDSVVLQSYCSLTVLWDLNPFVIATNFLSKLWINR